MSDTTTKPPEVDHDAVRATFSLRGLLMAATFKAERDVRYYLGGIFVQRAKIGGVMIVGCDGHAMCVYHDEGGVIEGADSVIIRIDKATMQAARRNMRPSTSYPVQMMAVYQHRRLSISSGLDMQRMERHVQPGVSLIEAKYPDWTKLVPDFAKLREAGPRMLNMINTVLLAKVIEASRLGSPKKLKMIHNRPVRLWQQAEGSIIYAQLPLQPEACIIMMPIRGDDDALIDPPAAKEKEAAKCTA